MTTFFPPSMYRVYIAFDDGPLVESPTWVEVTDRWMTINVQRGSGSELDDIPPGTATVVLDNRDRELDPTNTASTYVGKLTPRRPIKIDAVVDGDTYEVFRGVIRGWRQRWAHDDGQTVEVSCVDILSMAATFDLAPSAYEITMRSIATVAAPSLWFRLGDDANAVDAGGSNIALAYGADRDQVDALDPEGDGASRIAVVSGTYGTLASGSFPALSSSTFVTFTAMVRSVTGDATIVELGQNGDVLRVVISGGVWKANCTQNSPSTNVQPTASTAAEGLHHVALVRNVGNVSLFVDGVLDAYSASFGTNAFAPATLIVGDATGLADLTIDEVAVWQGWNLGSSYFEDLTAAMRGWAGDRTDERIARILDMVGVPAGLQYLETGSSCVGVFEGGSDALATMQRTARSENGMLFVSRAGLVTYLAATHFQGASVGVVFADDGTVDAVPYSGYEVDTDERYLYNEIEVTGAAGTSGVYVDATSRAAYGPLSLPWDTALPTDRACASMAQGLAERYSTVESRGSGWMCDPVDVDQMKRALGVELGDLASVTRTPPVGDPIVSTVVIVGMSHDADNRAGTVALSYVGAPTPSTDLFVWGTSTWDGSDGWR